MLNASAVQSLRRVFNDGFAVHDIAEPLVSFDASASATEIRSFMEERSFEVVGVRDKGLVAGYLERTMLADGPCSDFTHPFGDSQVILDSASFTDVVLGLRETPRLFVSLLGRVGGIVTQSDLQKPPVRMWLFGMVTLIEMRFAWLIERFCPGDGWKQFVSEARVQKAEALLAERTRRNQSLDMLDCLQFSDKGQIVARNEEIRGLTQFQSRRQVEQVVKQLERLRNNLAHAQDIIATDWDTIVLLSENLDDILLGPPGLRK
jgi:CBS domain-containing protein